MAFEGSQPLKITRVTSTDLSAAQYHFVKLDTDGEVVIVDGATDLPIGVLQNNPDGSTNSREAEIVVLGVTKVEVGTAIDEADVVAPDANGEAQPTPATGEFPVGQCLKAGAAGSLATIVVNCIAPTVTA